MNLREKSALVSSLESELAKNDSRKTEKVTYLQKDYTEVKEKLEEREKRLSKMDMDLVNLRHTNETRNKEIADIRTSHETIIRQMEIEAKQNLDKLKRKVHLKLTF